MSDHHAVRGRLTLRHGDTEATFDVDDAVVTFVRHRYAGRPALAVTISTKMETVSFGQPDVEFPIGPSMTLVLDGADQDRDDSSRWVSGSGNTVNDSWWRPPMPMLYVDAMHPITRVTVELATRYQPDKQAIRLSGEAGGYRFDVQAAARYGGMTDHDPEENGAGWFVGHFQPQPENWPTGTPLTESRWRSTDQFRRLCRDVFPRAIRTLPSGPSPWRIASLARRLGLLRTDRSLPRQTEPPPGLFRVSDRQAQLIFAALIEFHLADNLPNGSPERFREMARIMERFADGIETEADRQEAAPVNGRTMYRDQAEPLLAGFSPAHARDQLGYCHLEPNQFPFLNQRLFPDRCMTSCDLIRCLCGNPFRSIVFDPAWRTPTVLAMVRGAYEGRDFSAMPILADALEDAGCADELVLAHCRDGGRHARGCWVLDGLLTMSETPE